jgi:signal transduction histidine kinase/ligand-binding sensor domain-containing protein
MNKLLIPFLVLFGMGSSMAQVQQRGETGYPFVKNFEANQYKAHAQNFAITRDHKGIMYFGNFAGVLQFDGEFWRLIPTAKTTRISSLATDSIGTVYVGARGEIGILNTNKQGEPVFKSLTDSSNKDLAYQDVIRIFPTPRAVYFLTKKFIFILSGGKLEPFNPGNEIISGFYVHNTLFLQLKSIGLVRFDDRKLTPVTGGSLFAGAIEIKSLLPYLQDQILIASGTQGLYLLGPSGIKPFPTQADDSFRKSLITSGVILKDDTYAFGTSRQGVIILYPEGSIKQIIDKRANLYDQNVQALFADDNNILWTALNNGIAMIEIPASLSYFDDKCGLNGSVNHIIRFKDRLYVSTYQGLFWFDEKTFSFKSVPQIITACWGVVPFGNELLAATSQGIFSVSEQNVHLVIEGFTMSLIRSKMDPSLFFVGEMGGFSSLRNTNGHWTLQQIGASGEEINDLQEDSTGAIWGATLTKGVFRFTIGSKTPEYFKETSGLPETAGSTINILDGKVTVATRQGVFIFVDKTRSFQKINLFGKDTINEDQWFSFITETKAGNLWVNAGDETQLTFLEQHGSGFQKTQAPFLPIADRVIWAIYPEDNGVSWFGGPDGLFRFDPSVNMRKLDPWPTLIRRITTHNDSLIYSGVTGKIILPYHDNSLRIEFSSPFYSALGENQYQYLLEGFEETWSDWSTQSHKEYTNLPKGNYIFHVRARNVYDRTSKEATFSFRILAPWYTTGWAFFLYFVFAAGLIYVIVLYRNRQLLKEKRLLEQKISERTAEVVQQKEEIEKQSEELANKNDELEKINIVVKAINSEINFLNLLQSLLEKTRMIKSVDKSTALVFDKTLNAFKFKASFGWDVSRLDAVKLSLGQAEKRYLKNAEEIFEDIFLKTDFSSLEDIPGLTELGIPKSMLVLVIKVENKVEAFLILENMNRENAFENKDLSFIRNSKEHIISAFIKTRILEDLQQTLQNLKETQDQLIQSEKLASLGALTAGIAHEIQNPLNFVNNFSSLSGELADELDVFIREIKDKLSPAKFDDTVEVIAMIKGNVQKINEHGKRAESIVKGMLQHSRGRSSEFEEVDINNMVAEYVNLAYHGMRAKDKSFNTSIKTQLDPAVGKASIVPQDLSRVILNIVNNSCYALDEKTKKHIQGFAPEVIISTSKMKDKIEIRIKDNGTGIPDHVIEKIFNPFFTTKPTGKGTGLGLSMSFDIVTQIHKGKLEVKSKEGEFTEFIITIPERQS